MSKKWTDLEIVLNKATSKEILGLRALLWDEQDVSFATSKSYPMGGFWSCPGCADT
jgi:hypothetical protein